MKHHFYQYVDLDQPTANAWIERMQAHAQQTFANQTQMFPPPLPEDPELARLCLHEWYATLDDLICVRKVVQSADRSDEPTAAPLAFRLRQGVLRINPAYPWRNRAAPVFRSARGTPAGSSIIYSDIVPLGDTYALLELRGSDRELRLNIASGGKNQSKIYISLYTKGHLVEKSLLGTEVSWDLSNSEPGRYQLELGSKPALSFQIQE